MKRSDIAFIALAALACCAAVIGWAIFSPAGDRRAQNALALETPERLARIRDMAQAGPRSPDYFTRFSALNPASASAHFGASDPLSDGLAPQSDSFPVAPNDAHTLVSAYCTGCHNADIIKQQRLSKKGWAKLLVWMTKEQGMAPLMDQDEGVVLDYLAEHYGPSI